MTDLFLLSWVCMSLPWVHGCQWATGNLGRKRQTGVRAACRVGTKQTHMGELRPVLCAVCRPLQRPDWPKAKYVSAQLLSTLILHLCLIIWASNIKFTWSVGNWEFCTELVPFFCVWSLFALRKKKDKKRNGLKWFFKHLIPSQIYLLGLKCVTPRTDRKSTRLSMPHVWLAVEC